MNERNKRTLPGDRESSAACGRFSGSQSGLILGGCALVAAIASPAAAFESDPFLALRVDLADAVPAINEFLNREIQEALDQINAEKKVGRCEELPPKIFSHLFTHLVSSRLKHFLEHSPQIDRFPADDVGYWEYLRNSIYRRPIFPYIVPMSSIIEVAGVRVGVDKFGHMLGEGRRYYKLYLRGIDRGLTAEEAERRAILKRLRWERALLGGLSDGVVSFADLEANYQGLKLARGMCEGPTPHLARAADKWRIARPFRIEKFIVPALDESFYPNRFPRRWKRVRPILEAEHCSILERPEVQKRFERYRREDQASFSRRVVEVYFAQRGIPLEEHSLHAVCTESGSDETSTFASD